MLMIDIMGQNVFEVELQGGMKVGEREEVEGPGEGRHEDSKRLTLTLTLTSLAPPLPRLISLQRTGGKSVRVKLHRNNGINRNAVLDAVHCPIQFM